MTSETLAAVSAGIALLSAAGAWSAVLVNRRNATDTIHAQVNVGARNSRASVVSANRQKWIDAIRDDLAEFSAARSQLAFAKQARALEGSSAQMFSAEERELKAKLHMLRARVDMRLNHIEADHLRLLKLMDCYSKSASQEDDDAMRKQGRDIFKAEWTRLKKEASGIDPFVREAVPERR